MQRKGIVVSAFAGTGKSFLAKHYENVVDLDSGNYKFIYDESDDIPLEARKAMKKYELQPEWPQNYFDAILQNIERYEIVLVTFSQEVKDFLYARGIDLYYFMPDASAWEIIERRLRERANNERFIEILKARFYCEVDYAGKDLRKMSLGNDEFLEQALMRNGLLNTNK